MLRDRGFDDLAKQHEKFCEERDKIAQAHRPQEQPQQTEESAVSTETPEPSESQEFIDSWKLENEKQKSRIMDKIDDDKKDDDLTEEFRELDPTTKQFTLTLLRLVQILVKNKVLTKKLDIVVEHNDKDMVKASPHYYDENGKEVLVDEDGDALVTR